MTQVNGASMGNCRNVLASIVLTAALFAPPGIGSAQEQVAPTRDVTRSKVIRTRRLSIPADFFQAGCGYMLNSIRTWRQPSSCD